VHHRRAAYRAWRSYRGTGFRTRAFLAARLVILPLRDLAQEFAQLEGQVLGVGSGHGLIARFAAEVNPRIEVEGIDVDRERVAIAEATRGRSPRVRIRVGDVRALAADAEARGCAAATAGARGRRGAAGVFDAAAAVDLMHHVPVADRAAVAYALARAVRPGGVLLVKDIAPTPRWKHAVNRLHDRLVSGEATTAIDPTSLAELFAEAGFETERIARVGRLSPYPHFILRARRAPDSR
jgi:SAM-dependent methyltransferase